MLNNGIPMKKSSYKEGMHSETLTFSNYREGKKWQLISNIAVYSHVFSREDMWLIKDQCKKISAQVLDPDIFKSSCDPVWSISYLYNMISRAY